MMNDDGHDGDFASVVWDTPASGGPSSNEPQRDQRATSPSEGGPSSMRRASASGPSAASNAGGAAAQAGDASGANANASAGRYWIKLSAGEPTKMLEGTKDAYVSYAVKGEVGLPRYLSL